MLTICTVGTCVSNTFLLFGGFWGQAVNDVARKLIFLAETGLSLTPIFKACVVGINSE